MKTFTEEEVQAMGAGEKKPTLYQKAVQAINDQLLRDMDDMFPSEEVKEAVIKALQDLISKKGDLYNYDIYVEIVGNSVEFKVKMQFGKAVEKPNGDANAET